MRRSRTSLLSRSLLWLGLLLGSAIPSIAEEPARDPKLIDLIQKVKEQESRYANYEMVITDGYKNLGVADLPPAVLPNTVSESTEQWRIIRQGELRFASRRKKGLCADGQKIDRRSIAAYDGKSTREFEDNQMTIHEGLRVEAQTRRPHTVLLGMFLDHLTLAEYLERTHADRRKQRKVTVTVEGNEEIDELECVKVKVEIWRGKDNDPAECKSLWLAANRNYFPIKSIYEGTRVPLQEDHVVEWSEIEPGLWIPKKMEVISNDWDKAAQGLIVQRLRREYRIEKIDLRPNYPLTFFQEIELPTETDLAPKVQAK